MIFRLLVALLSVVFCSVCYAQTPIDVEPVRDLKPTGSLGTCGYKPTVTEAPFLKRLQPSDQVTGSFEQAYTIHGKKEKYVSWFGINRGILGTDGHGTYTLRLEHQFFDGLTDCHIMLVSNVGSGDFTVTVNSKDAIIPPLVLLRVYGTVADEADGLPHLIAQYVRVWPWLTFTFTDLGPADQGNPEWKKYRMLCKSGRVYRPYPDRDYYIDMLGDPRDFGTVVSGP